MTVIAATIERKRQRIDRLARRHLKRIADKIDFKTTILNGNLVLVVNTIPGWKHTANNSSTDIFTEPELADLPFVRLMECQCAECIMHREALHE